MNTEPKKFKILKKELLNCFNKDPDLAPIRFMLVKVLKEMVFAVEKVYSVKVEKLERGVHYHLILTGMNLTNEIVISDMNVLNNWSVKFNTLDNLLTANIYRKSTYNILI